LGCLRHRISMTVHMLSDRIIQVVFKMQQSTDKTRFLVSNS
jgi:hypothetical protein